MKLVKGHTNDEKPRTRESETLKLKEMPTPETYREWKTSVREDVRAASDRPDEACPWIMEVWSDREDKKRLSEELGEPGNFVTLDTNLLAALTRSEKGVLAQRILTAKEECAKEGKAMGGRLVLFMFDQYFKTSEEAGNLYSLEDLLRVSRHGKGIIDLKRFLNAWDSVIAGMKRPPEEKVLKDIWLRQVRSCHLLRYDIDTYDRCRDDDPNKSYDFLMRCMRDLIERDRLRENGERVSKVDASKAPTPKAGAAAPERKDPKKKSAPKPKDAEEKYCFDFQKLVREGGSKRCSHPRVDQRGAGKALSAPAVPDINTWKSRLGLAAILIFFNGRTSVRTLPGAIESVL